MQIKVLVWWPLYAQHRDIERVQEAYALQVWRRAGSGSSEVINYTQLRLTATNTSNTKCNETAFLHSTQACTSLGTHRTISKNFKTFVKYVLSAIGTELEALTVARWANVGNGYKVIRWHTEVSILVEPSLIWELKTSRQSPLLCSVNGDCTRCILNVVMFALMSVL